MNSAPNQPAMLSYERSSIDESDRILIRMNFWRRMAIRSMLGAMLLIWSPHGFLACFLLAMVCGYLTLSNMTAAALREGGKGYARRQFILALLAVPFFFAGVVIVPLAVESDISKWRKFRADQPPGDKGIM